MSDVTRVALVAVLSELLAGCPPGGTGPIGTCATDAAARTGTMQAGALGLNAHLHRTSAGEQFEHDVSSQCADIVQRPSCRTGKNRHTRYFLLAQ